MSKYVFLSCLLGLVLGCETANQLPRELGTVSPQGNGIVNAYGLGANKSEANKVARSYANTFCRNKNQRVQQISIKQKYQGAIKEKDKDEVNAYAGVIGMMSGRNVSNGGTRLDYKSTLQFRCR